MTLTSLGTIILSVTLSAIGQVCFKFGLNSLNHSGTPVGPVKNIALALLTPGVMAGLGFYVVGTLLWLSALGRLELSQAYPFVSLGFALDARGVVALQRPGVNPARGGHRRHHGRDCAGGTHLTVAYE
jgi:hypothetical protein